MLIQPPMPPLPLLPPPPPPPLLSFPTIIASDSETALIQRGLLAPPLVCVSTAVRGPMGITESLHHRNEGMREYRRLLTDPSVILAIHNGPFDLGVACAEDVSLIPIVFDAFERGGILCSITTQKLIDIALGMRKFRRSSSLYTIGSGVVVKSTYYLEDLIQLYYGEKVQKEDTWRLSYGLLYDVPIERWPASARKYATWDAVLHLRLQEAQRRKIVETWGELPNQLEQQRSAFALHLMPMWGVRAERAAVDRFIENCRREIDKMHRDLADTGIFKGAWKCVGKCEHTDNEQWVVCPLCQREKTCRKNPDEGKRTMAEIRRRVVEACARLQMKVPMTDPSDKFPNGQVQVDKDTLELTDDPDLHILATQMTFEKHLGQWGPVCEAAVHRPVCSRYDIAETGRTTNSGSEGQDSTNFQNPPRKGDVRPCWIPRSGWVFCSTDADTIELRAHAQNCLELVGWSKMAEALWDQFRNKGPDLHLRLAAQIMGIHAYDALNRKNAGDKEVGEARQFAKIPNFGFPGGLGPETMITYAAAQLDRATHRKWFGETRDEQFKRAKRLREIWFETWPENRQYFKIVADMIPMGSSEGTIRQLRSKRIRGGTRFTAIANGFFQGRVIDGERDVLWHLAQECYTGRCYSKHAHGGSNLCTHEGRSVLYGSRPVLFLHDEPILEHPYDGTESDRAERQQQIVVENLSAWMDKVPITSSAVLMFRWTKGAEPLKVNGRHVPVRSEEFVGSDGKKKVKWVDDSREYVRMAA